MIANNLTTTIEFEPWHRLLHEYVNDKGQVDYRRWKADSRAVAVLQDWLKRVSIIDLATLEPDFSVALLINL